MVFYWPRFACCCADRASTCGLEIWRWCWWCCYGSSVDDSENDEWKGLILLVCFDPQKAPIKVKNVIFFAKREAEREFFPALLKAELLRPRAYDWCTRPAISCQKCLEMPAAHGNVAIIAANLHLGAFLHRIAGFIQSDHHGCFRATVTDRFQLL